MINELKVGAAIQYHSGYNGVYAAQVTHVWGPDMVNLIFWDPDGATWRERSSVPRLMWSENKTGHTMGFATLDQEGIAK